MSQAEELLSTLSVSGSTGTEPHIVIADDRYIDIPAELKSIAVQYDHNVETVTFDCPRYWDEHDFSTMRVYINYLTPDGRIGQYVCNDVAVDDTDNSIIHFSWTISNNVTQVKGNISFLVCIKSSDASGDVDIHWNSRLNTDMVILPGLEWLSGSDIPVNPDVIESILSRLDALESGGGSSVTVDDTLTVSGAAADAKVVGDALKSYINDVDTLIGGDA